MSFFLDKNNTNEFSFFSKTRTMIHERRLSIMIPGGCQEATCCPGSSDSEKRWYSFWRKKNNTALHIFWLVILCLKKKTTCHTYAYSAGLICSKPRCKAKRNTTMILWSGWHAGTEQIPGNSITRHWFKIFPHLVAADEGFRKYFNFPDLETLFIQKINI